MPVTPEFNRAGYTPLALRGLLRARRDRGERLVAWGVADVRPAKSPGELLGLLGPLGWIAGAVTTSGARRVVVLTDQRLLLLRTGPLGPSPEGLGVVVDAALGGLRVSAEASRFELLSPELGRRIWMVIGESRSRDGSRLREALLALAGDSPS